MSVVQSKIFRTVSYHIFFIHVTPYNRYITIIFTNLITCEVKIKTGHCLNVQPFYLKIVFHLVQWWQITIFYHKIIENPYFIRLNRQIVSVCTVQGN